MKKEGGVGVEGRGEKEEVVRVGGWKERKERKKKRRERERKRGEREEKRKVERKNFVLPRA